ncbi:MAG: ATP synthase F1 subunit gamma [Bacteroidota bacterium]
MPSLKEVKGRIKSVTSTQQITKAMKMVAASKLRRAQEKILQMRPYSEKLSAIIQNVAAAANTEEVENPFAEERSVNNVLLVVVTSDRGLCGAFNSNVFKFTRAIIEEKYKHLERSGNVRIMPIGKRSFDYFAKRKYKMVKDYAGLMHSLNFGEVRDAAQVAMDGFLSERYDRVVLVYNEFKNVATQILREEQFLPIVQDPEEQQESSNDIDYIFEPSQEVIFEEIIPNSLKVQFYKALLESNASEHGARMTAMDQATDNASELLKELKLTYNRTRQAAITKEILEIVGGAEALSKGG